MAWSKLGFDGDDQTSHTCLESKKLVEVPRMDIFPWQMCQATETCFGCWLHLICSHCSKKRLPQPPTCPQHPGVWNEASNRPGGQEHGTLASISTNLLKIQHYSQESACWNFVQAHAFKTWCKGSLCQITIQETAWFPRPPIAPTETIESLKHIVYICEYEYHGQYEKWLVPVSLPFDSSCSESFVSHGTRKFYGWEDIRIRWATYYLTQYDNLRGLEKNWHG